MIADGNVGLNMMDEEKGKDSRQIDSRPTPSLGSSPHDDTTAGYSQGAADVHKFEPSSDSSTAGVGIQSNSPPPPPNGGYGWVCVAAVATINAHTWGLNSSYGVFLAHYLRSNTFPGASTLEYAFVGSLSIACAMLISPFATFLTRMLGTKPTMLLGTVFLTASFIGASFATKIWHLFLTQGILFGFGMGLLFVPSVGIVPQWFTTRRSLANGISACGSGLGGVVYSFAAGALIKNYGVPWTFRSLGIIACVVNVICVIIVKDRNKVIGSSQSAFNASLFKRPEYLLLLAFGWFSVLGYIVLIFSLANYANEIGLDSSQAAIISAMFNLGQGVGRPFVGYFSDTTGRMNMAALMTFMTAVFTFAIWINAKAYGVLIFFSIVGGMVGGTFWTVVGPLTAEVVGLKNVPSALNLMWLALVLPSTFSEPIALQIVSGTGSYLGTQLFVGFMYTAAALCLVVLRGWKIGETSEMARLLGQDSARIDRVKIENDEEAVASSRKVGRKKMLSYCYKVKKV